MKSLEERSLTRFIVHRGDCYGAPRALLILEAQASLANFLRDFATATIANIQVMSVDGSAQKMANMTIQATEASLNQVDSTLMQFGLSYYNVRPSTTIASLMMRF